MQLSILSTSHEYLKLFLDRTTISNKNIVLIGDINLNLLDFYHSHSVKIDVNKLFKNNLLTLINKPTRVTSKFISAIGHIFFYINSNFKSLEYTEYTRYTKYTKYL